MVVGELSIDTMLKVGDDKMLLGCEDGVVRTIGIHPNEILQETQMISSAEQMEDGFGMTKLVCSRDKTLVAGITFGDEFYFKPFADFQPSETHAEAQDSDSDSDSDSDKEVSKKITKAKVSKKIKKNPKINSETFFKELM